MKKTNKFAGTVFAVLFSASVLTLSGCSEKPNETATNPAEEIFKISEVQAATSTAQVQETASKPVIRDFSNTERARMETLKQSYQNETAKPERKIPEAGSMEEVTEESVCYVTSTGEYHLPDRELTDEELLEIIDCNFRIALGTNRKTQADYEAEDRAKRAMLEEKVQAAGGISEEKAIELAQKALETDLGERGKGMQLRPWEERYGWKTDLCVADWSEIKKEDKGAIGYYMQFDFGDNSADGANYHCTVNAVDGSILEAYEIIWNNDSAEAVYYEH